MVLDKHYIHYVNIEKDDLIKRADLEESTIDTVVKTLKKEFE